MVALRQSVNWLDVTRIAVQAIIPIVIFLTSLRLLMTQTYVRLEYSTPDFPADPYGFTKSERIHWAQIALEYILNDAEIDFLGDLQFENGDPVYNARELRHMVDVKRLAQAFLWIWRLGLLISFAGLLALWIFGEPASAFRALYGGSRFTLVAMVILTVLLAVSFSFVFVGFHRIFFEGNTWLFPYSDTLIRLFPERFWRDVFLFLIGLTVFQAGAGFLLTRRLLESNVAR